MGGGVRCFDGPPYPVKEVGPVAFLSIVTLGSHLGWY